MTAKTFEIRDRMTFIPVLAIKLDPACPEDRYLIARAGYGTTTEAQSEYVIVTRLVGDTLEANHDPFNWRDVRTLPNAHQYIIGNFDSLKSGAVIDVEFILGESDQPKVSEMHGG